MEVKVLYSGAACFESQPKHRYLISTEEINSSDYTRNKPPQMTKLLNDTRTILSKIPHLDSVLSQLNP
jgi:hypothetical protein